MILNNLLTTANEGLDLKSKAFNLQPEANKAHISFKSILDSKADRAETGTYDKKLIYNAVKDVKEEIRPDVRPIKQKVFRELEKAIRTEMKKSILNIEKEVSMEEAIDEYSSLDEASAMNAQKSEMFLSVMSQLLGIKSGEMNALLESAGINPEELKNSIDTGVLSQKISDALKLNEDMKVVLTELLEVINVKVEELFKNSIELPQDKKHGPSDAEEPFAGMKIKVIEKPAEGTDINELSLISDSIDEIKDKLMIKLKVIGSIDKSDRTALVEALISEVQPLLQKIRLSMKQTDETVISDTEVNQEMLETVNAVNAEGSSEKSLESNYGENKSDKANDVVREKGKGTDSAELQKNTVVNEAEKPAQQFVDSLNQIQSKNLEAAGIKSKNHVPAKEILTQVIERAKVVLTGDKSEMVMDLKPDSLGKISLKVITEHGIVMAKFVAENQQVKQVLEVNMQLLKDSLEKQGLEVQGFSVSVRQEQYNSQSSFSDKGENNRKVFAAQGLKSNRIYRELTESRILQHINPYLQETATINLRA